jgi:beta-galactosidase
MDLCGFEKTAFWLHQAQWRREPVLHLAPHWNWDGQEGRSITVMALHNLDEVELFLNGRSLGRQQGDIYEMNRWQVPYVAGRLSAVAYRDGREAARFAVDTTGPAVALRLSPDRDSMAGDGIDAQPFKVEAVDAQGRPVPQARHNVRFAIEGADIIGLGNGDPNDVSSEKGDTRALFNGLAQVIVQTRAGSSGRIRLRARADGLRDAVVTVAVRPAVAWPMQATSAPLQVIKGWRSSPASAKPLDPGLRTGDNDMNSWGWVNPGAPAPLAQGAGYMLYAADVTPFARVRKEGGVLELTEVAGRCRVFVDGRPIGEKTERAPGPLRLPFPAGPASSRLSVLFTLEAGQAQGLSGPVHIRTEPA